MKTCRTCLQVLGNDANCLSVDIDDCSNGDISVRRKLLVCVPEIALDMQELVICIPCSSALNTAYYFKNKCLQTEEKILKYIQYVGCNRESVNILEVVNFNITGNSTDSDKLKQSLVDIHHPTTHKIEQDADIKSTINSCDVSEFMYPDIPETDFKIKSEYPEDVGYPLPDHVIFSSELDIEVRTYKNEDNDIFNQINPYEYYQKPFIDRTELDAQTLSHRENRPLKCSFCSKGFVRKDKLQLHMRTHTGEKPFECSTCKRCFSRKDKLNNHMRTHTGEKPHQCILCQRCFSRKDKMNTHMKRQHWLALANLEITPVKNNGVINKVVETNVSENSAAS